MSLPRISLQPVKPSDYLAIARLECAAFWDDAFSQVAFGPLRGSDEALRQRVKSFEKKPSKGESVRSVKAVVPKDKKETAEEEEEEKEEIVGFAHWGFREGEEEKSVDEDVKDETADEGGKGNKDEQQEEGGGGWGPSANVKFCEDVFLPADEFMLRATKGKAYAKLYALVVSPSHQRRGIGTLLLGKGLKTVDEEGLQAVLGATPEAEELYKRFGFVEEEIMDLRLGDYEGGEGMGSCRHLVMWRPARGTGRRSNGM